MKRLYYILSICFIIASCKKSIEVDPPITSTNATNVYKSDATAAAALTGIYSKMSYNSFGSAGITSMSFLPALSSDELTLYNGVTDVAYTEYYRNNLTSSNRLSFWEGIYPLVFAANSALEGLNSSTSLTPSVKNELLGEAKFIRAFSYFYLANLYGDVPLLLSTDWQTNAVKTRAARSEVYQQVIADLKDAQNLLTDGYVKADAGTKYLPGSEERVRPNKWAATALLARVYLYNNNWSDAEAQSTMVINQASLYNLVSLNEVFKMNSQEAIWQLQPVLEGVNTSEGKVFVLTPAGPNDPNNPVYMNSSLVNAFDPLDQRKQNWIDSVVVGSDVYYYPFKYKVFISGSPVTEYTMVLRLAEQYLIRAEARAQQNNITGSQSDLNAIRTRAGLDNTAAGDKTSLVAAILQERQRELFTEWGHRWFDLKRTGRIDAVMNVVTPQKGGSWQSTDQLYPIPLSELQKAPQLTQNSGY